MNLVPIALVTLAAALAIAGCQRPAAQGDGTELARVGSNVLTVEDAAEQVPEFMLKQDSVTSLLQFREEWIERQVILQETRRLDLNSNPDVRRRLQRLQEEVLIQALKDYVLKRFDEGLEITDEEARNYYQAHKEQLVLSERYVRFRHMVTPSLEAARSAKRDLMRGIEWPEVARDYAVNPETRIRESEKFWPISMAVQNVNVMNRMLQRIGITEISPIHRVSGNYHFVQLMEARAEGDHPDLEWLMEQIKEWLRLEKRRRHFNSYVKNLYLNAQSNNEIETYNVLQANSNTESIEQDTLASSQTDD
ncbi:MAG: hypothetical protein R3224_01720 [Balneolaceae bacterium]|nr:hypothetical protein [Balneolaceae bacterium]